MSIQLFLRDFPLSLIQIVASIERRARLRPLWALVAILLATSVLAPPPRSHAQTRDDTPEQNADNEELDDAEEFSDDDEEEPWIDYTDLWIRGDYEKALKVLDDQIENYGSQFPPYRWRVNRARLKFDMGDVDEAIEEITPIAQQIREPSFTLQLALFYRYRGRMDEYRETLARAEKQSSWGVTRRAENFVAMAYVLELQGKNPKWILNTVFASLHDNQEDYAPGFVGAGDLALRKSDYGLAEKYYLQALEIEEENPDALSGLAEAYWKSGDPRVAETIDRLLDINPRRPEAKAIQIEQLLDSGHPDEALKIVKTALKLNPIDLRIRSLQAAAYFLLDDLEKMEALQSEVLAFNPACSEVFRVPGRVASRHYRFEEAANFQRRALELDPFDHQARTFYALDLLRLGEEEIGRSHLERAFEQDSYNVHAFNMLNLLDTLAEFDSSESGPFILSVPAQESIILKDDALALLHEAFEKYEAKYDIKLKTPVRVQIFDNHDDFMVRSVGLPGSIGYMGICFGQLVTMDSPSARTRWSMNWHSVLWHEFVHVITLQKTNNRIPRWLSEGISVYEETQHSKAWGQRADVEYKPLIKSEPLPGLSDMELYFTQAKSALHLMMGYFLAGEFVGFYVDAYGFDALREGLDLIGQGVKTEKALARAAGLRMGRVDKDFKEFLEVRLAAYDNLPEIEKPKKKFFNFLIKNPEPEQLADEDWAANSSPFTDALGEAATALEEERWDDAEAFLKTAHFLFPEYMGADAPLRQLTQLYYTRGEPEKLKETLREEIGWNSTDFPSHQMLATLLIEEQAWEELIEVAQSALSIDPFDTPMRQTLLDALVQTGDEDGALGVLGQLARLNPARSTDYRLRRIGLLHRKGKSVEAKHETLMLLEELPHFWEAQKLLLEIVESADSAESGAADGQSTP